MTGIFEKSIKTKRAAVEIQRLLQYAWENSKFLDRTTLNQLQLTTTDGTAVWKNQNYDFFKYPSCAAIIWSSLRMK